MKTNPSFEQRPGRVLFTSVLCSSLLALVPAAVHGQAFNTTLGTSAFISNTTGSFNTALGTNTLFFNTTGERNTAVGASALVTNSSGSGNTAMGFNSMALNATGGSNSAFGDQSLVSSTASNNNAFGFGSMFLTTSGGQNCAFGSGTMFSNRTGASNCAFGHNALNANTGSNNTAIGFGAGVNLTTGSSNICIGNAGVAAESGTIRIGTPGTHTRTVLSGQVGIGTIEPSSTLHVSGLGGNANLATGHVVRIQESAGFTALLALQSNFELNHTNSDNFITFFNKNGNSLGSIEGNGAGSVQFGGAGSDYAEYLPKADPEKSFAATEIVGVRGGQIVNKGDEADQFMVITGQAIVAGNRPSEDEADLAKRGLVSFIGQVPVQVCGKVNSGDFILSSENGDGTGIALSASNIPPSAMHRVVGRAWEGSTDEGLKVVNTAVGLDQTSLVAPALERLERENRELRAALKAKDEALEARLAHLEQAISGSAKAVKVALTK